MSILSLAVFAPVASAHHGSKHDGYKAAKQYFSHHHERGSVVVGGTVSAYDTAANTVTVTVTLTRSAGCGSHGNVRNFGKHFTNKTIQVNLTDTTKYFFTDKSAATSSDIKVGNKIGVAGRLTKPSTWTKNDDGSVTPSLNAKVVIVPAA